MTLHIFNNPEWIIAQKLWVFRTTANGAPSNDYYQARKISSWIGAGDVGYWQTVYPDAPFAPVTPIVTGVPAPELSIALDNYLIWDYSPYRTPDTVAYQWQRSSTIDGTYSDISGATGLTYTVQNGDIDYYLRCRVRGTNERAVTDKFSTVTFLPVPNPYYTFSFGTTFGVNANAFILFDKSGATFPSLAHNSLVYSRVLRYFTGNYRHFRTWYKSDTSTFRVYHQMYRDDRGSTRPATPDLEYEIVFTNGSNIVDVYVVNPVSTSYITSYVAWGSGFYTLKSYNSGSYAAGIRFRVVMNSLTAVTSATVSASTTAPSVLTGWIPTEASATSSTETITFSDGGTSSSNALSPSTFTKSNMFYPSTPTTLSVSYSTSTTASLSWSGSNANGYWVRLTSGSTEVYSAFTTSTSITATGLSFGTSYSVAVHPISRGAPSYDGQYGFPKTDTYVHQTIPSAVKNVSVTNPRQSAVSAGNSGGLLTWNIAWNAPDIGAPITRYEFDFDLDDTGSTWAFDDIWTSNGTSTSSDLSVLSGSKLGVRVRAVNAAGAGPYVEVVINSSPSAPGTPTFGSPAINATNAQTTLNWTASDARGGTGLSYRVYRGQNTTTIATDRSGLITNTSYTDNIAGSGTGYYYRVVPQNTLAVGNVNLTAIGLRSNTSSELTVTQPTVNVLPFVSNNARQVSVFFSANLGSGGTPNYSVFRGQNTNPQSSVGNLAGGNTNTNNQFLLVTDSGNFALNTTYYYKVSMTNSINTVNSSLGSITTPSGAAPGTPGTPSGSANNTNNNVNISWSASNANGGGTVTYTVFRGQGSSANTQVGSTTSTQFQDSYANPPVSGSFRYRVTPSTPWGGTGTQSGLSAKIPAS